MRDGATILRDTCMESGSPIILVHGSGPRGEELQTADQWLQDISPNNGVSNGKENGTLNGNRDHTGL